jgi:methionine synthase II (cobalamin-independent)
MLTRADVIARIEEHLAGSLSAPALAAWAFDRFYAHDMDAEEFCEEDAEIIAAVLDDLMFADDAAFALDEPALRTLITQLQ